MRSVPTEEFIAKETDDLWAAAVAKHGSDQKVPNDVRSAISDRYRALHAVRTGVGESSLAKHLRSLMIPEHLIIELVETYGDGEKIETLDDGSIVVKPREKSRGGSKQGIVLEWINSTEKPFTIAEACAGAGVAHMVVRKVIKEHPEMVEAGEKRGQYQRIKEEQK